jgi:hypothetical protein
VVALASWSEGAPKAAIVDFAERMTQEGGAEDVPPSERVAVFDSDGEAGG